MIKPVRSPVQALVPAVSLLGHRGLPWAYPPSPRCVEMKGTPPAWPAECLSDALTRRHAADTWFQTLTVPGASSWPRFRKPVLREFDSWTGPLPVLAYAGLDLDRPDHRNNPWSSFGEAADALTATLAELAAAGWPGGFGYATRNGLRVLWWLDEPIPLVHAQSFLDQLHAALPRGLPVSVDRGVKDWTRGYRVPWCPRADGKVPAWGDDAPPTELSALRDGQTLTWRPHAMADETIHPPREQSWWDVPAGTTPADDRIRPCVEKWAHDIAESPSRHAMLLAKCRALGGLCQGAHDRSIPCSPPQHWAQSLVDAAGDSNDATAAAWDAIDYGANDPWWFEDRQPTRTQQRADRSDDVVEEPGETGAEPPPVDDVPSEHPHAIHDGLPYLVLHGTKTTEWHLKRPEGTEYVAVAEKVLRVELQRMHPDLDTFYELKGERKPMGPGQLFERFGRRADDLIWSYTDDSTYRYGEDNGGVLVKRCCRLDPHLEPEWSDEAHEWMSLYAGSRLDHMYDWFACGTLLHLPIAAIYHQGRNGCGKGMLTEAFARQWGVQVASYGDVMGITSPFNAVLRYTPVVRLDERAPKSPNGSAAFREFVGNSSRSLTEKNKTAATLIGCPRLIITANNPDALRFGDGEHLDREDEEAIAIRVLHIPVQPEARAWLEAKGGRAFTERWVNDGDRPGVLTRHLFWLTKHWKVRSPGNRFLVDGTPGDWFRNAHLRSGLPATVLDAIGNYLTVPGIKKRCEPQPLLFDRNYPDHVIVSNQRLRACWTTLLGSDQRGVSNHQMAEALERLAPGGRQRLTLSTGERPWGYVIPMSHLGDRVDP